MAPTVETSGALFADVGLEILDLELLILFGSAARGRIRTTSDVDVAVQCDAAADLDALFMALAPRLKTGRVDLVDLRRAGPLLAFEVARSGSHRSGARRQCTPARRAGHHDSGGLLRRLHRAR